MNQRLTFESQKLFTQREPWKNVTFAALFLAIKKKKKKNPTWCILGCERIEVGQMKMDQLVEFSEEKKGHEDG